LRDLLAELGGLVLAVAAGAGVTELELVEFDTSVELRSSSWKS